MDQRVKAWKKEIENEHDRMLKCKVYKAVEMNEGQHYYGSSIHAPVTNLATIHITQVLMLMAGWIGIVVDVKGAFLHVEFTDCEEIYMKVPKVFERHYKKGIVLRLLRCIYGLKQAAMALWRQLLKCMRYMKMERSTDDPCLYFKWDKQEKLVLMISWIDDNIIMVSQDVVKNTKQRLMQLFDCSDEGELKEFVGNQLTPTKNGGIKFTQPVLIQSLSDEFDLPTGKGM